MTTPFPAAADLTVRYNVTGGWLDPGLDVQELDAAPNEFEYYRIRQDVLRTVDKALAARSRPLDFVGGLPAWDDDCIADMSDDRTLQIVLAHEGLITSPLITALIEVLATRHPSWRLLSYCDADRRDLALAIYRSGISIGNECFVGDTWRGPIEALAQAIGQWCVERYGRHESQLSDVRVRVREVFSVRIPNEAEFIKGFRWMEGGKAVCSLWFVVPGESPYDWKVTCVGCDELVAEGHSYPVLAGEIDAREDPYRAASVWVVEWLVPPAASYTVNLSDETSRVQKICHIDGSLLIER